MIKTLQAIPVLLLLVSATLLEVSGDAVVRMAIYHQGGSSRWLLFGAGAVLLFGYGSLLNVAPMEFGQVVGLYVATLFVVWQLINYAFFGTLPTLPTLTGGACIITGGAIVSFWRPL